MGKSATVNDRFAIRTAIDGRFDDRRGRNVRRTKQQSVDRCWG